MQYVKRLWKDETKWTNVLLRIRTVIWQLTLQAKAIQTPEELCQAAPSPSPLGTLHLLFPGDFSQLLHPHRQHSHWWRGATVLRDNELIPPVDTSAYSSIFNLQAPISFLLLTFQRSCLHSVPFIATPESPRALVLYAVFLQNFLWSFSNYLISVQLINNYTLSNFSYHPRRIQIWERVCIFSFGGLVRCLRPKCNGIQGTVGFWISRLWFRIPCTFHVHVSCCWKLFSGFQSLVEFWIPQEKCRIGFWILQEKIRKGGGNTFYGNSI